MIPQHLIQKSIISKLRSSGVVTGSLVSPNNILEDQYQGTNFSYPSIRVSVEDQIPLGNAVGRTKLSLVTFDIIIQSEKHSSAECNKIGGIVINNLFDSQIKGSDENNIPNYFILNRIDLIVEGKSLRTSDRLFEKVISFMSEAYLL